MQVYNPDLIEANRLLLQAAMHLSPTGRTQEAFSRLSNESSDPIERAKNLLGAMLDGLQHGNWIKIEY